MGEGRGGGRGALFSLLDQHPLPHYLPCLPVKCPTHCTNAPPTASRPHPLYQCPPPRTNAPPTVPMPTHRINAHPLYQCPTHCTNAPPTESMPHPLYQCPTHCINAPPTPPWCDPSISVAACIHWNQGARDVWSNRRPARR